jgi:hypothetical protein
LDTEEEEEEEEEEVGKKIKIKNHLCNFVCKHLNQSLILLLLHLS